MTRILLIRHGETEWNKLRILQGCSEAQLSNDGVHQARLLASYFPFQHVDAVYSSDLSRAVETAEILAEKFNLPVVKVPELREVNFGDWEGRSIRELAEESPDDFGKFFVAPEDCKPPNGEIFSDCQTRVVNAIREIIARHDRQNVIVVSHGAAIRLAICAALEMPLRKIWAIGQYNTALNVLRVDDGRFTVELVNSTAHLH